MSLSPKQIKKLEQIIFSASALLKEATGKNASKPATPRKRRSGKELIAFRKMLKSEIASGVSVADLAKTHGVTSAYIYQFATGKDKKALRKNTVARPAASKKVAAKKAPAQKPKSKPKKVIAARKPRTTAPAAAPATDTEQGA